jgi:hypothetical protein
MLTNTPDKELAIPSVDQIIRAEVRRDVRVDADFLICSRPEDMATGVAQKLRLVAGAFTSRGIEGDRVLLVASQVTLHMLGPCADEPLPSKRVHEIATMAP